MRLSSMENRLPIGALECPANVMINAKITIASLISRHHSSTRHMCAPTILIVLHATIQDSSTNLTRMKSWLSYGARISVLVLFAIGHLIVDRDTYALTLPMRLILYVTMIRTSVNAISLLKLLSAKIIKTYKSHYKWETLQIAASMLTAQKALNAHLTSSAGMPVHVVGLSVTILKFIDILMSQSKQSKLFPLRAFVVDSTVSTMISAFTDAQMLPHASTTSRYAMIHIL